MNLPRETVKFFLRLLPKRLRDVLSDELTKTSEKSKPLFDVFSILKRMQEQGWEPDTIIDIGAHEGLWSKTVASCIFPKSRFHLFEPLADKKSQIEEAMKGFDFYLHQFVLSNRSGIIVPFYEMETGSSIYFENSSFPRKINYLESHALSEISDEVMGKVLMKVDVQGAEMDVLKGAGDILENVEVLVIELSLLDYNRDAPLAHELIKYVADQGFILFDIAGFNRKVQTHALVQLDGIFVKEDSIIRRGNNDFSQPYNLYTIN